MARTLLFFLLTALYITSFGQYRISGLLVAEVNGRPVERAMIRLVELRNGQSFEAHTDTKGIFLLEDLAEGMYEIEFMHPSFESRKREIEIKEASILNLLEALAYKYFELEEVAINEGANELPAFEKISGHSFDPKFQQYLGGAMTDPVRLLANFPGVSSGNDIRNDLVVRGNSPVGVLWQLEGMEIYNPNHFATSGNSGGGVNILNPTTLGKSSFLTGAFSAEYGNATSAVFNANLRNGNTTQHQLGFRTNLIDWSVSAEGPISREQGSSYLFAYRNSTFAMLNRLDERFEDYFGNQPSLKDFTYKLNFPIKNGNIALFGLGGKSQLNINDLFDENHIYEYASSSLSTGASLRRTFGTRSSLNLGLMYSNQLSDNGESFLENAEPVREFQFRDDQEQFTIQSHFDHQLYPGHRLKVGGKLMFTKASLMPDEEFYQPYSISESFLRTHVFANYTLAVPNNYKANFGLHATHFGLNNQLYIEPRASIGFHLGTGHSLGFAMGVHSKGNPLSLYLASRVSTESDSVMLDPINMNTQFAQSFQTVITYNGQVSPSLHLKAEAYYFKNFSILDRGQAEYSGLNIGGNEFADVFHNFVYQYSNNGAGKSIGLELSAKANLPEQIYLQAFASIYNATYQTAEGEIFPTIFNGNQAFTLLSGKRFDFIKKSGHDFRVDLSINYMGGRRFSPEMIQNEDGVITCERDDERIFGERLPAYFRTDLKFTYEIDGAKARHQFYLDIRNMTNRQNVLLREVRNCTDVRYEYQLSLLPLIGYNFTFSPST